MHGIKFDSFVEFIFEWRNSFVCLFICLQYMYYIHVQKGFIIFQLCRPCLKLTGLQNPIRVLHFMVNSDSYVRIGVSIMNFYNQCVDFSISEKKCWSKIDI